MHHVGGAQQVVHHQAEELVARGHEVHVVTASNSSYSGNYQLHSVTHLKREISLKDDWKAIRELRKLLKTIRPDIVSIHSSKAGTIGRLAALRTGISTVYTFHGVSYLTTASRAIRFLGRLHEKVFSMVTDHYIFLTVNDQQMMRAPKRKSTVIANGIHEPPPQEVRQRSEIIRLLWVGRLSPPKDPLALVEALAHFKDWKWHLDMIGTGPLEARIRERIIELGLQDFITTYGELDNPHPFYNSCDVVILLSDSEGIPLVLLEAMAHKKPIIASATPGMENIIKEGKNGYIVRQSIYPYLSYIFLNPNQLEVMGKKGYLRYRHQFTFDQMMHTTENLLKQVVKKP